VPDGNVSPSIPVKMTSNGRPTVAVKVIIGWVLSQANDGWVPLTHRPDHSREGNPIEAMEGDNESGVQT
jgi:hypothetical protein